MTDGAATGKVLMSYSDGTAYWATPSSGGGDSPWQTSAANHIYYNPGYSPGDGGNVGIGTDSPLAKLDIDGDLRIKENLSFNGANNANITFGTASVERTLKIVSNLTNAHKDNIQGIAINGIGSVGIGKDNPTALLDVNGDIKATEIEVSGTASCVNLQVSGTATTNGFRMINGAATGFVLVSNSTGNASWQEMQTSTEAWSTNANHIYRENGFVGIGTAMPEADLHIGFGANRAGIQFYNEGATDTNISDYRIITSVDGSDGILKTYNPNWRTKYSWSCGSAEGPVEGLSLDVAHYATTMTLNGKLITQDFKLLAENVNGYILQADADGDASWVEPLWTETGDDITFTGKVGIGTENIGTHALAVNGSINATEILVTESVPSSDYVFEDNYKLMPLSELETYVNTNKHLPEVKSAKEFKENGYNLGKMDDVLLRKVEELTLYMIAQQKVIDELIGKVSSLEEQK